MNSRSGTFLQRTFVFAADQDLGESIDLTLDAAIPGYVLIRELLTASRIESTIQKRIVALARVDSSFGVIEVRFSPLESIPSTALEAMSSAGTPILQLTDLVSGQHSIVELSGIARGFDRIEGIPFGSYSVVFEAPGQLMRFPPADGPPFVPVVGALDAELEVPVGSLGCIHLDPTASDGASHAGPIMVGVARLDLESGQEVTSGVLVLRCRPYAIPFLPSGTYRVDLLAPAGVSIPVVRVEASVVSEVPCSF